MFSSPNFHFFNVIPHSFSSLSSVASEIFHLLYLCLYCCYCLLISLSSVLLWYCIFSLLLHIKNLIFRNMFSKFLTMYITYDNKYAFRTVKIFRLRKDTWLGNLILTCKILLEAQRIKYWGVLGVHLWKCDADSRAEEWESIYNQCCKGP